MSWNGTTLTWFKERNKKMETNELPKVEAPPFDLTDIDEATVDAQMSLAHDLTAEEVVAYVQTPEDILVDAEPA